MRIGGDEVVQRTALVLFRGLAKSYDSAVDYATLFQDRRWKRWVLDRLENGGAGEVLDVGCGTLLLEERLVDANRRFVGVDLSREMVRAGKEKGLPNVIAALNGDAEALPFPDGMFSAVVSCYVAKYVDMRKFAREVARVSKPGAVLILYDFAKPKGLVAPFLGLYIRGGLRIIGFLLGLAGRPSAFAYANLPAIIDGSTWDTEVVRAMESGGFQTLAAKGLTGGVVFAYCGRKGS